MRTCPLLAGAPPMVVALTAAAALAQPLDPGPPIAGDRLGPELLGPAVVETMDVVLERQRALEAAGAVPTKGPRDPGEQGVWVVPSDGAIGQAASGTKYVANRWGDVSMGIGFPEPVTLVGASFVGQGGGERVWARGVRFVGYRDGQMVGQTPWLRDVDAEPTWLAAGLAEVDRVVVEADPAYRGAGYYGMDDLTFVDANGDQIVLDFEDLPNRATLTGLAYAGLEWEEGTGDFELPDLDAIGIPAPVPTPDELVDAPTDDTDGQITLGGLGTSPGLVNSFRGPIRADSGGSFPPDTCGAAGPTQFVSVVNVGIQVFDKATGDRLFASSLAAFQPGTSGDPRVLYDQHADRWVVMSTDFDDTIFFAVSLTSDATGAWFKTSFIASQGSDAGCWPDYPTLGVDARGIYIAANMFGGGCDTTIWAVDKTPILANPPSLGAVTAFRDVSGGTWQPVHTYGDPGVQFLLSRRGSSVIGQRSIIPPLTAPTLSGESFVSVPSHGEPPNAPALGSDVPLNTVGTRLMNALHRNGSNYAAHTISFAGRSAARWYEIDASTASLAQVGTINSSSLWYLFPSIAVSSNDTIVLGLSGSNASQFVATYFTGRLPSDPPGQTGPVILYQEGQAAQNLIDGFGRNRFGDYSLTTIDPVDDTRFWTIQESVLTEDNWATYVAELSFDCDGNGQIDAQEIAVDPSLDCNGNGILDICEINAGTSFDCDGNGVPDECEGGGSACPFALLEPADGATGVPTNPVLRWEDTPDASTFRVFLDDDADFSSPLINGFTTSQGQIGLPPGFLDESTLYFWKVVGISGQEEIPSVPEVASFTTVGPGDTCPTDFDFNGATDLADLNIVLANFGDVVTPGTSGDADGSGIVNLADLNAVLAVFGTDCP